MYKIRVSWCHFHSVEKMEVASTAAALVKPNYNFALALFTEKERRKTFKVVPAGYVNVSERVSLKTFFITSESSETIRSRHRHLPPGYAAYSTPPSVYQCHKEMNWLCPLLTGKCLSNVEFSPRALNKGYPSDDEDFIPNWKKMLCSAGRLWSFEFFPKRYIVSNGEMARWGLYYTGIRDETSCIFCRLILHNWEYGDNTYEEHRRFPPNCPLIRGRNVMDIPCENSHNPDDIKTEKEGKEMIDALNRRSPTSSFKSDASSELIVDEGEDSHHSSGAVEQGGEK
ncbi:unnamed protein product [Darwinula stevensoni]|uniref:Uncharacterized protein n=1 Tax=Darwinula stevensoni TaxID=69355 RepID=A0A7R8X6Z7_9CRUS|nr:unnamed protein product [Darwinula stevensoni]CAG0882639.1 unnamed protein product [Darwinula stevensoni]